MAAKALDSEIKKDNKIVAGWLLYYHERKIDYEQQREFILHSSGPCLSDVIPGGTNITSDTTGRKGQKLGDLQDTEKWLALVEEVERRLPWKLQKFLLLRREYRHSPKRGPGRPSWVPVVQRRYAEELAKHLGKAEEDVWINSPNTFHEWWDRIVDYTARLAGKRGLL